MAKQVQKIVTSFLIIFFLLAFGSNLAFAVNVPDFPSCTNPQGAQTASHSSGIHGIVGSFTTHSGSDSVFQVDSDRLIQCFCPENGVGIQTNWWKASSLSEDEINQLKKIGWIFVPNGALWGLTEDPFLALNNDFACKPSGEGGGGTGGSSVAGSSQSQGGVGGGTVLAAATQLGEVLGLASTGNNLLFYSLPVLGLVFLALGLLLKKLK